MCHTANMPSSIGNTLKPISLVLSVTPDRSLLNDIKKGYSEDPWCVKLQKLTNSLPGLKCCDGLMYINDQLIIPCITHLRETIFRLAHDKLGHFGINKSYTSIHQSYYWLNMRHDLEESYIPACPECA
jgi:hypothetical protein